MSLVATSSSSRPWRAFSKCHLPTVVSLRYDPISMVSPPEGMPSWKVSGSAGILSLELQVKVNLAHEFNPAIVVYFSTLFEKCLNGL